MVLPLYLSWTNFNNFETQCHPLLLYFNTLLGTYVGWDETWIRYSTCHRRGWQYDDWILSNFRKDESAIYFSNIFVSGRASKVCMYHGLKNHLSHVQGKSFTIFQVFTCGFKLRQVNAEKNSKEFRLRVNFSRYAEWWMWKLFVRLDFQEYHITFQTQTTNSAWSSLT